MAVLLLVLYSAVLTVHQQPGSAAWALLVDMRHWALPLGALLLRLARPGSWQWQEQLLLLHRLWTGSRLAEGLLQASTGAPGWPCAHAWYSAAVMALLDALMFKVGRAAAAAAPALSPPL
jgi:hypothetical protein